MEKAKCVLFDAATYLEDLSIELENILNLLAVYAEHREKELNGLDPKAPWTTSILLSRQGMGDSILNTIQNRLCILNDQVECTHKKWLSEWKASGCTPETT